MTSTVSEWRIDIIAELCWDVAPRTEEKAMPWSRLEHEVVEYYHNNTDRIQSRDTGFEKYTDKFINTTFISSRHTPIRMKLMEQGRFLADAYDKNGRIIGLVRGYTEEAMEKTIAHRTKVIDGQISRRNDQVELANRKFGTTIPILTTLLEAGT